MDELGKLCPDLNNDVRVFYMLGGNSVLYSMLLCF
jgi:hypothetical protein